MTDNLAPEGTAEPPPPLRTFWMQTMDGEWGDAYRASDVEALQQSYAVCQAALESAGATIATLHQKNYAHMSDSPVAPEGAAPAPLTKLRMTAWVQNDREYVGSSHEVYLAAEVEALLPRVTARHELVAIQSARITELEATVATLTARLTMRDLARALGWGDKMPEEEVLSFAVGRELMLRRVQSELETQKSPASTAEEALLDRIRSLREAGQASGSAEGVPEPPQTLTGKLRLFVERFRALGGIPEMCDLAWTLCNKNEELEATLATLQRCRAEDAGDALVRENTLREQVATIQVQRAEAELNWRAGGGVSPQADTERIDAFLAQYKRDWSSRVFYVREHLVAFTDWVRAGGVSDRKRSSSDG